MHGLIIYTFDLSYPQVLQPRIQPTSEWKYLGKKILETSKKQTFSLLCYKFLHSIYIVGDIISNLDMIESMYSM